jgi:integrase
MKLTRQTIAGLSLPKGKTEAIHFDEDLPGFGLRVRAGGSRMFVVQYKVGGKQRRLTLGSVKLLDPAKARGKASDALAAVRLGRDPAGEKAQGRLRATETLEAAMRLFLTRQRAKLRPASYDEIERYLLQHWKPLHGSPIVGINRRAVAARLAAIADRHGPVAANRARTALSGLFSWAIREGLADTNPVIGTNKAVENKSRDRVLTDTELLQVWQVCKDDDYGRIIKLLILTGQRRDEIGGLQWSEVDLAQSVILLPPARTKNNRAHQIPLSGLAKAILKSQPRLEGRSSVFGQGDRGWQGWSRSKADLDKMTGIAAWTVHDLRRTVATRMGNLGVQPHVIEALLNHVSGHKGGVAGIYNRAAYEPEKATALALWADHIAALLEKRRSNVTTLKRG